MIADPPFDSGALHEIVAWVFPGSAVTEVGASGTVRGVVESEALDALDSPRALIATTVNVYPVPFVNPVTVHDKAPVVVQVCPPLEVAR